MSSRPRLLVWTAVALLMGAKQVAAGVQKAQPDFLSESAQRIAAGTCAGCHGARGISGVPKFPNLAGQSADYLAAQLKAFRERTRREPDAFAYMWGMAASLDEQLIAPLAQYYARQSPAGGTVGDANEMLRGRNIYDAGIPSKQVVPCSTCHGLNGEGNVGFPRLAGQKGAYVIAQLRAFQHKLRESAVMQPIVAALQEQDLEALAAYIESR